ncbi:MAG: DNA-processing protein DprA [Parasphingorhabdus sp.]
MNKNTIRDQFSQNDFDRLRLIRSANIGPVTYVQLLKRFGSAERALNAIPDLARRGGGKAPRIADANVIQSEIQDIERLKANLLFIGDQKYPRLLAELSNAPPILIYRGSLSHLNKPIIAIVGARNASAAACRFARDLANSLNTAGATVVSGLARGIDTAAHQGSLGGSTIGVIAGGIDIYYPPENKELQEHVSEQGLLLSEQPPGTEPRARHFPYRNRIIAGMAAGTVIVEAAPRSGSLITARIAAEAGRHVMAIPGSPLDPRSRGCNNLIREGATLVQCAEDVMELVQNFDDRAAVANQKYNRDGDFNSNVREQDNDDATDGDREIVGNLLSITSVAVDELIRQSGINPSTMQLILLELELAGKIVHHAGGKVSLKN